MLTIINISIVQRTMLTINKYIRITFNHHAASHHCAVQYAASQHDAAVQQLLQRTIAMLQRSYRSAAWWH